MYQNVPMSEGFHAVLFRIDQELASAVQEAGCECGGRLHRARYPRKPRGGIDLGPEAGHRLSFCCNQEGCRRRRTPASVRFLGRKVYLGAVVLVASALDGSASPSERTKLLDLLGVSRRTLRRWQGWWRITFVASPFWQVARGYLQDPLSIADLPQSLLEHFKGSVRQRVLRVLKWISPITIAFSRKGLAF